MKNFYLLALFAFLSNSIVAQITPTTYRGAFAPAPAAMWTDNWTNFDPQNTVYPTANITVNTAITSNTTWTSGNTYLLSGLVYVKNNATLTIQPGTKILGDNSGSALIVTRGAKINATGTAANPIVFTSDKAVGARNKGDWGGIVLLGKGSFNINGGVNNIEGITASPDTQFGGGATPDDNDNSGTLKYVRIEFGGYVFAPNSEINGLTFGAVGRGTTIDYVQVSNVNDDAFEWFGGSVDCKHLVSFRTLDDDFDTDNGYNGRVQFALAIRDPQVADAPAVSTSEGFESDNNATGSTVSPFTSAIFSNLTMVGPTFRNTGTLAAGYKRVARIRRASQLKIYNSVFMDFLEGIHIDGIASENAAVAGTLRFNNNVLAGITTTSRVLQVTAPGTITSGNNASFNMTSWYAANANTTVSSSTGLLATPYNLSNLSSYTGLDYRPAANSILLSGASFSDSFFNGILEVPAPDVVAELKLCRYQTAVPLTATLTYGATQLRWYTVATGGTFSTTAPTPLTTSLGTKNYYVSQVNNGTEGPRALIAVTVYALPGTPLAITGTTSICSYVGTTNTRTYSIAPVSGVSSYVWTLPAGVNLVSMTPDELSITVNFLNVSQGTGAIGPITVQSESASGCLSGSSFAYLTRSAPKAPRGISGTVSIGDFVGTPTEIDFFISTIANADSYLWEVPAGVTIVSGQGTTHIKVNFMNTAPGVGTLGNITVKAVSGCLTTAASNLTLYKYAPARPGVVSTTHPNVCLVVGTPTLVTYSIAQVPNITNYTWTVPNGATIVGPANGTSINVNYASYPSQGSVTVSSVSGTTTGSAKVFTVTRTLPLIPDFITGPLVSVCPNVPYGYSFPSVATATSYAITSPAGSVVKSANFPGNSTNTLVTTETNFTVTYPSNFVDGSIIVSGVNGCSYSLFTRKINITKAMATPNPISGPATVTCAMIGEQITYTEPLVDNAVTYTWTPPAGATIVSGQGTNSVVVTFSNSLANGAKLKVKTFNNCGGSSVDRNLVLSRETCSPRPETETEKSGPVTYSSLYPNPSAADFNIDINSEKESEATISVFSFTGNMVSSNKYQLKAGENTINTNLSRFPRGIYIVTVSNSLTNEIETRKFVKN